MRFPPSRTRHAAAAGACTATGYKYKVAGKARRRAPRPACVLCSSRVRGRSLHRTCTAAPCSWCTAQCSRKQRRRALSRPLETEALLPLLYCKLRNLPPRTGRMEFLHQRAANAHRLAKHGASRSEAASPLAKRPAVVRVDALVLHRLAVAGDVGCPPVLDDSPSLIVPQYVEQVLRICF